MAGRLLRILCILCALCFLSAELHPCYAADLTTQELGIMRDEIERLQDDVSTWKTEATRIEDRAARYEKMAKDAKAEIEKSKHQADKDHWKANAEKRTQRAKNLRDDAAKILAKARKTEDEINTLRKNLKGKEQSAQREHAERNAVPEKRSKNAFSLTDQEDTERLFQFPLEKLIGMWEIQNLDGGFDPGIITLVPEQPDSESYAHNVLLYTNDAQRIWKGKYHAAEEHGAEAMVTLSYTPKSEEMNSDIPKWARKQIEGELEWKMELHQDGTWGTPRFIAKFYPGEVEWDEKALESEEKSAWVIGKGKPREYTYKPVQHEVVAYGYGAPELHIRMTGAPEGDKRLIEALTKRQEFFVEVFLPPDLAKQRGRSLTVDIKGLKNASATTLELKAGKIFKDKMTTYSHRVPVTIATRGDQRVEDRDAPPLSLNWVLGNKHPGKRLSLNIENSEEVEFYYDGSSMTVPVYNSYAQRGIARHVNAMNTLRGHYSHIVQNVKASNAVRNDAQRRLNIIRNYESILTSKTAHDKIKYAVGEKYFGSLEVTADTFGVLEDEEGDTLEGPGLVGKSEAYIKNLVETTNFDSVDGIGIMELTGKLSDEQRKGSNHKSGYFDGALWTHPYEMALIIRSAEIMRDKTRQDAYDELPLAAAYALYTGIAAASNVDSGMTVYTFFYSMYENKMKKDKFDGVGRNIMGKKVQDWEVGTAAVGFTAGNVLSFSLPQVMTGPSATNPYKPNATARIKRMREVARTSERKAFTQGRAKKYKEAKARLNKMTDAQMLALEPKINYSTPHAFDSWNTPIGCASTKKTNTPLTERVNTAERAIPYEFRDLKKAKSSQTNSVTESPPPKSAVPMSSPKVPPRPTEFTPADKPNIADDVTAKDMSEIKNFYPNIKSIGKQTYKPQDFGMCNCMFWMKSLAKKGSTAISEVLAFVMGRKLVPGDRPIELEYGMTDKVSVALAEKLGFKVIYNKYMTKRLDWETYAYLVEKEGYIVRGTVKPKGQAVGQEGNHAVAFVGFGRNAAGDIIDVTFYDPAFGREITMDVRDYEAIAMDGYGLFMLHKTKQATLNKLMKSAHRSINKPTIVYPKGHSKGPKPNKPATKGLDETWHDLPAANENTPSSKSLDETWSDGDAMPPPKAVKSNRANSSDNGKAQTQKKGLDETWVEEDFDVPSAQSAVESSGSNVGTSKDPASQSFKGETQKTKKDVPTPPDPNDDD